MILKFKKGSGEKLSDRFTTDDFDCKCTYENCEVTYVDSELVAALEYFYPIAEGFKISSGYRCSAHNEDEGGKPGSQHLTGKAADLHPKQISPQELSKRANTVTVFRNGGIGTYPWGTHVDVRGHLSRWTVKA